MGHSKNFGQPALLKPPQPTCALYSPSHPLPGLLVTARQNAAAAGVWAPRTRAGRLVESAASTEASSTPPTAAPLCEQQGRGGGTPALAPVHVRDGQGEGRLYEGGGRFPPHPFPTHPHPHPSHAPPSRTQCRKAQDAWNTRNPEAVAMAYTPDSQWRNRDEFFSGREVRAGTVSLWHRQPTPNL